MQILTTLDTSAYEKLTIKTIRALHALVAASEKVLSKYCLDIGRFV